MPEQVSRYINVLVTSNWTASDILDVQVNHSVGVRRRVAQGLNQISLTSDSNSVGVHDDVTILKSRSLSWAAVVDSQNFHS